MPQPSLYFIIARQFWRLILWSTCLIAPLSLILALGQCLRLRQLIWPLDELGWTFVGQILWGGTVILSEAALPITALIAPMIVGTQSQRTGLIIALESLGKPSTYLHIPALIIGIIFSALSLYNAHIQTPHTLQRLTYNVARLSEARWRQVLPLTISTIMDQTRKLDHVPKVNTLVGQALESLEAVHSVPSPSMPTLNQPKSPEPTPHIIPDSKPYSFSETQTDKCDWSTWVLTTQDQNNQMTWLWSWSPCRDLLISARWHDPEYLSLNAKTAYPSHHLEPYRLNTIKLYDVLVMTPQTSMSLQTLSIPLSGSGRLRMSQVFGPPNSLEHSQLDPNDVHHSFILHKRSSLPLSAIFLSILGSCWGIRHRPPRLIVLGISALTLTFGLLRYLELLARAHHIPAVVAAWLPLIILSIWMCVTWQRSSQPVDQ